MSNSDFTVKGSLDIDLNDAESALKQFKRMLQAAANDDPLSQIGKGVDKNFSQIGLGLVGVLEKMHKAVQASNQRTVAEAKKTGKDVADAMEAEVGKKTIKVKIEGQYTPYNAQTVLSRDLANNQKAIQQAYNAMYTERQRLQKEMESARNSSASKFSEDDTRTLFGLPSRDGMKSFAAQLKAQMQADQAQLVKDASENQARMLASLKNQTKAMWSGQSADQNAALTTLKNQSKVMWAEQAQTQQAGLERLKSQSKAMWADKAKEQAAQKEALQDDLNFYHNILNLKVKAERKAAEEIAAAQKAATASAAKAMVNQSMQGLPPDHKVRIGDYSAWNATATGSQHGTLQSIYRQAKTPTPKIESNREPNWAEVITGTGAAARGASRDVQMFSGHMNDLHSAARGVASGFNAMWLTWGNIVPLLAGAGFSNMLVQTAKLGTEFESVIRAMQNLGEVGGTSINQLSAAALQMGLNTQYGPIELAKGLKTLTLAGLDAGEALAALPQMMSFATVAEMPLDKASESLMGISKAFGYTAERASVAGDVVAKAAAVSMSSVSDMTEAFKQASTVAQQYGVSVQDASVSLALLSNLGIKGASAGTAVRNMYNELIGMGKEARKILSEKLGVNVFDEQAKALKPLATIMKDLFGSLSRYDFESQIRMLTKLGGERGMKTFSADLIAMATAAKESGKDVNSVFDEIKKQMEDAPGFTAKAAAGMASSTENIMKQVPSALQSALIQTFEEMSPYLVNYSIQLRDMFKSNEFKEGLAAVVRGVGEFTGLLVDGIKYLYEHRSAVVLLIEAYAGFKILQALGGMLAGVAAQTLAFNAALVAQSRAAAGAEASMMTLRAALIGVNTAMGVVGLVLAAGAAAWGVYQWATADAADQTKDSTDRIKAAASEAAKAEQARFDVSMESMQKELDRLDAVLKAKGDDKLAAQILRDSEADRTVQRLADLNFEEISLKRLEAATKRAEAAEVARIGVGGGNQSRIANLNAEADALEGAAKAMQDDNDRQINAYLKMLDAIRTKSKAVADLGTTNTRLPKGSNKYNPDEGSNKGRGLSLKHDNELQQVEKRYADELSTIKGFEHNEQKFLKESHSAKLISDGQFYAQETLLAQEAEAAQLALIARTETAYMESQSRRIEDLQGQHDRYLASIKGKVNSSELKAKADEDLTRQMVDIGNAAVTFWQKMNNDGKSVEDNALARVRSQAIKAAGAIKEVDTATEKFWRDEANNRAKAGRVTSVEDALRYATPESAAYISAAASETERINDLLYAQDEIIRVKTLSVESARAAAALEGQANDELNKLYEAQRLELDKLIGARKTLAGMQGDMANISGQRALTKFRKDEEAALKNGVADAIVTGLFEGGQAGKGKLRNLIMAELRKPITVVVQAIVNPVMGALLGSLGLSSTAAAGQAGDSMLGSVSGSVGSSALSTSIFGPGGVSGFATSVGEGVAATISGTSGVPLASAGSTAFNIGASLPYVGAALLALNALGAFRTTRTVGGGLSGTLGSGDIQSYDLTRTSGTLFSGPDYNISNKQKSAWSEMIQNDWKLARNSIIDMAKSLDLATDGVKNFTTTLGTDVIHPDTGGLGIKLDDLVGKGLTDAQYAQEVKKRISEAILAGSDAMAQELIGSWKTTTEVIKTQVQGIFSDDFVTTEEEKTVTKREYVVSEFARSNETAIATLTRLSTSLSSFRNAAELLGYSTKVAGLAGANAASQFIDLFGSLQNFESLTADYFKNFYTDTEQIARQKAILDGKFNDLGLAMPTTKSAYRAQMDAAVSSGDQQRIADLLKLEPALAALFDSQDKAPEKAAQDAQNAADAAQQLAEKYQQITDKLNEDAAQTSIDTLRALGQSEQVVALERQQAIKGMDQYQISLYDANQAKKLELKAINENKDLEGQLAELMGDTAFARNKELAALEPGNRALQQRIWALQDEKDALSAFYSATDSAAEALLSHADLITYKYARQAKALSDAGVGTGNVLADAQTLASLSPQQVRALAVGFVQTYGAANKATPVVLEVADALIQLANAANPVVEAFTGAADNLLKGGALSTFKVYSATIDALNSANLDTGVATQLTNTLGAMSSDELRQAAFAFLAVDENSAEAKAAVIKLADTLITMRDAAVKAKEAAEDQVRSTYKAITDALKAEEDKIISGLVGAQTTIIDGVVAAQTNVNNLLKESANTLRTFATSITDFINTIDNSDLSGKDKLTQYAQAQSQLAILKAQALAGDEKAQSKLTDTAQRVLELGRGNSATAVDYQRIVAQVKNSLQEVADAANAQANLLSPADTTKPLDAAQAELAKWTELAHKYNISDATIQYKLSATQDKLLEADVAMEEWTRLTKDAAVSSERIAAAQLTAVQNARTDWLKASELKTEADRIIAANNLTGVITAITENPQVKALAEAVTTYQGAVAALSINVSSLGMATGGVATSLVATLQPLVTAINNLAEAITGMKPTNGGLQAPRTPAGPSAPLNPTAPITPSSPIQDIAATASDLQARYGVNQVAGAIDFINSAVAAGDALGLAQAAIAAGVPSSDLSSMLALTGVAISASEISDWAVAQGLPRFASGGFHSGGLRLVGENGPELEATGAARIWTADQTRSMLSGGGGDDDGETLEVLQEVRDLLVSLGYEAKAIAGHTNKTARILTRVTQDGEAVTTTPLV